MGDVGAVIVLPVLSLNIKVTADLGSLLPSSPPVTFVIWRLSVKLSLETDTVIGYVPVGVTVTVAVPVPLLPL